MIELSPEVSTLIEAGFGVIFLFSIIIMLRLAGRLIEPVNTMAQFVQAGQENLSRVIASNTRTVERVGESIATLTISMADSNTRVMDGLSNLYAAQRSLLMMHEVGTLVVKEDGTVLLYNAKALSVMGWDEDDLPLTGSTEVPPILKTDATPMSQEDWPSSIALREGRPVEHVPMQIYSPRDDDFHWVLVSAYPVERLTDGRRLATVFLRRLDKLGRV